MKRTIGIIIGILLISGGVFVAYKGTDTKHLAGLDTKVNSMYAITGIGMVGIGIWLLFSLRSVGFSD